MIHTEVYTRMYTQTGAQLLDQTLSKETYLRALSLLPSYWPTRYCGLDPKRPDLGFEN